MIKIVNISDDSAPLVGANNYKLYINQNLICSFEHDRQHNGLAQCLRDAADAVELNRNRDNVLNIEKIMEIFSKLPK